MSIKGNELYQMFIELTGLESGTVEKELRVLMDRLDMDPETLSTEDIRLLMAHYLEEFHSDLLSPVMDDASEDQVADHSTFGPTLNTMPKAEA